MELDDFKQIGKSVKPPEFTGEKSTQENMDNLINELKSMDAKEKTRLRFFILIFAVFVVVYSSTFLLQKGEMKTGFSLIVLGMILALGYIFRGYLNVNKVDYTAPTTVFLNEAEKRYSFMTTIDWLVTVPLILLFTLGGSIVVYASFTKYFGETILPVMIYLVIMMLAAGVGFWASHKNWLKDKGWMLAKIREMKREFGM